MTDILTVNLPTCVCREVLTSGNRSEDCRNLIEDFFRVNLDNLMSFSCEKPRFNITSISLDTYRPIIENLVNLKIFTSKSEALRFILFYTYLNKCNKIEIKVKKETLASKILNELKVKNEWLRTEEIECAKGRLYHTIYMTLTRLHQKGLVLKDSIVGTYPPKTIWKYKEGLK